VVLQQEVVDALPAGHRIVSSTTTVLLAEALRVTTDHAFLVVVTDSLRLRGIGVMGCLFLVLLTPLLSRWLGTGLLPFRLTPVSDHMLTP
jgi:hypothetical protein